MNLTESPYWHSRNYGSYDAYLVMQNHKSRHAAVMKDAIPKRTRSREENLARAAATAATEQQYENPSAD
jgi:hypothetical protein